MMRAEIDEAYDHAFILFAIRSVEFIQRPRLRVIAFRNLRNGDDVLGLVVASDWPRRIDLAVEVTRDSFLTVCFRPKSKPKATRRYQV